MKETMFIPFYKPTISDEEINEVIDTLKSGWLTTGLKTQKFEEEFSQTIGAKHSIAVNSCTAGLELALNVLDLSPKDEVICSTMTFAATVNVIERAGLTPVLIDVDRDTLNMDVNEIEKKITPKTKVILVVHFAGHSCDMDKILEIKNKYNLYIIEDAAHALPTTYKDKMIGTIGDITVFSFYANKTLTTGEGGMVTCNDSDLAEKIRIRRLHGLSKSAIERYIQNGTWDYSIIYPGFKANMSDINASIGIHQLRKINIFHEKRKKIACYYNEIFSKSNNLIIPTVKKYSSHAWWIYVIRLKKHSNKFSDMVEYRNKFIELLRDKKIGTSVHFKPIHMHEYYKRKYNYSPSDFPVAYEQYKRMISLPIYPLLDEYEIEYIAKTVLELSDEI